ncbi:hypothetical protein ACNF42_07980 [Cuniculiplasma sp. SKW3]|uniref:hypothetical protein n=1 Tax=Cuniculiplasma sp. SKW3 TaxID=3400170 RepID=UPI003FD5B2B2
MDKVMNDLAEYVNLNMPRHIIIYGSNGSDKMLSALTMAMALKGSKSISYYYVNAGEISTSVKIY